LQEFIKWQPKRDLGDEGHSQAMDYNTIKLELKVECTKNVNAAKGETDPLKLYHNAHVYAHQMKYIVQGRQDQYFSGDDTIAPVHPDILIAKLRPGQCIDVEMHAIKGVGSDHAKFSPVATASYRLLPTITITKPIIGQDAVKFQKCFPEGVIALEPVTDGDSEYKCHTNEEKAVVKDTMKDTVSRECLRHEEFEGKVKLGRVRDHFIFSVESTGQWDSDELFLESVKVLRSKCEKLKRNLASMVR
jgi:DNA-directed RNA polymerase I and III subunit RPAC1